MKYENAKGLLPDEILKQVQKYAAGKLLYVPIEDECKSWGEVSGQRLMLIKRNLMICNKYSRGTTISELADEYFLSLDSIKKIIYSKKDKKLEYSATLSSAIKYYNAGMGEEWVQTYLMFCSEDSVSELIKKEYIYFGIVKIPLRLIEIDKERVNNAKNVNTYKVNHEENLSETAPFIIRYEKNKFYLDLQNEVFIGLKKSKVNAYPAFILASSKEEYKIFMKNYGRHFILVNHTIV